LRCGVAGGRRNNQHAADQEHAEQRALILAWKNAGYFGLDFFLLRKLGPRAVPASDTEPGTRVTAGGRPSFQR
jgi:hypothetical protein